MKLPDLQWNATEAAFPSDLCIHTLFERQVAKSPQAVALIDGDKQLTYEQINSRANQLARVMQQQGVVGESVVGCHLKRSSAIVVFTLAILKAGGTYVLFDANLPASRLEYVIGDCRPLFVITDTQLPSLSVGYRLDVMSADGLVARAEANDGSNLAVTIASTNAAYIAYTSGSTGRPKGVIITHRATVNHASAFSRLFRLLASDRVPLMAPLSFDMAIEEMVPPLVSGCTWIVSHSQFASMQEFNREILDNAYTILNVPAPLWREWTDYLVTCKLPIPASIRLVIAGSEEIDTKSFMAWKRLVGAAAVRWVAAYGTTETTVTSTFYTSAFTDDLHDEPFIPIGKPIANTYAYILDDAFQKVGVGESGELYIGGEGLAREYLHRQELTSAKFLPDPFRSEPGARMYRTGDLARYRSDGNVVWLGLVDAQFKRYGLRIEPAEIEAVLNQSPSVRKSVVVLQRTGDQEADKHLVAFIETKTGEDVDVAALRQLAFHNLSTPMVPDVYVRLGSLPVNGNGKIDRKALENYPVEVGELERIHPN